jgi:peptide deformylase
MILQLKYYGDPILRKKAQEVKEITPEIQQLARDMIETMEATDGIGLAATQVGHLLRIYVSNVDYEREDGEVIIGEPRVYINPVLSSPSEALVERSEGCLSIPKLYAAVVRPLSIVVDALDINGVPFRRECYGYLARNMMHENDHLNGVLFIDRIQGKARQELDAPLRAIKKKYAS